MPKYILFGLGGTAAGVILITRVIAARTYFKEFVTNEDVGLVDGGMWANNPPGVAVVEGVGTLEWAPVILATLVLVASKKLMRCPHLPVHFSSRVKCQDISWLANLTVLLGWFMC
jgi:hypothetical protein